MDQKDYILVTLASCTLHIHVLDVQAHLKINSAFSTVSERKSKNSYFSTNFFLITCGVEARTGAVEMVIH